MRRVAGSILCGALLIGCSSATPNFVKLDASGKKDLSARTKPFKETLLTVVFLRHTFERRARSCLTHRRLGRLSTIACATKVT